MLRNLKLQTIDNYEIIDNDMLGILDLILNLEFKILCLLITIIENNNFQENIR